MKVAKFGGSSLASATQIKKVANIVNADSERRIVVVSAPGKRSKDDVKVTDLLIACAEHYLTFKEAKDELERIIERFRLITEELELDPKTLEEITQDLNKRLYETDTSNRDRFLDVMKSAGEDNCARVVSSYLQKLGVKARYMNPKEAGLIVSDEPGNARILPESYETLAKLRDYEEILVFPGFFGYSKEGEIVTFSRGGSDITGSIVAAAVKADLYENFTDVDSVYVANPNIIDQPKEIKELTYREMRELSYAGFSVFHDEALIPAFRAGIPVCIKNTNNPLAKGTMIVAERKENNDNPVVGIASDKGFCSIYVSKYLMNREVGFGRRLLQILEEDGVSYEHLPSGIDDISVIMREDQLNEEIEQRVVEHIKQILKVDHIDVQHGLALIMVVGEGMSKTVGMAHRVTKALADAFVNIEMINQGSSEVSMMFGVKEQDVDRAVQAIYKEFFN